MAIHSSILAWKIPRTEGPDCLYPMGSKRVGHYLVTKIAKQPPYVQVCTSNPTVTDQYL